MDASVLAKCFLDEPDAEAARRAAVPRAWIAPDLIFVEIASIATTTLKRGLIDRAGAEAMVALAPRLIVESVPCRNLASEAFGLAADHGFSAYDATYLTLARLHSDRVLTADAKLVSRAERAGLAHLVCALATL